MLLYDSVWFVYFRKASLRHYAEGETMVLYAIELFNGVVIILSYFSVDGIKTN